MPFDLGTRFVLRLIIPSVILACILFPLAERLRGLAYPKLGDELLFVATGLAAGFALLLLDMPIYLLLEGRRYWPPGLRRWGVAREARRLARLVAASAAAADPAVAIELDLQAAQYPLQRATGLPYAAYPTRLGNLLASFETYPTVKYGLDGVFFWSRLWVAIDKDLREELDSAQAVVDGAIYACAAFAFAAVVALAYFVADLPEPYWPWLAAAGAAAVASVVCYKGALPRYVQYGELFAAVFDQYRGKLDFTALVAELDRHIDPNVVRTRSPREATRAAWRFLRWHRYRGSARRRTRRSRISRATSRPYAYSKISATD